MIIFFLILTTLIDQLCDKSIYRPYLRLMTGFMLISLMMQPISYYLSNEDIVTQAISTAVKGENNPAFLDGAKEEKQNQIKEQITTLFSQYDLKVLDVDSKVNEKGTIIVRIFKDIPENSTIDIFGEIYEYFLGNFALAEGKDGGTFYTPATVVRYMVEVLNPQPGEKKFLDPACGSGGMFVQAARYMHNHNANESE